MCDIISNQFEGDYARSTRAIRLNGHATSVRLENYFLADAGRHRPARKDDHAAAALPAERRDCRPTRTNAEQFRLVVAGRLHQIRQPPSGPSVKGPKFSPRRARRKAFFQRRAH